MWSQLLRRLHWIDALCGFTLIGTVPSRGAPYFAEWMHAYTACLFALNLAWCVFSGFFGDAHPRSPAPLMRGSHYSLALLAYMHVRLVARGAANPL